MDTERIDLLILARLAGRLKKPPLVGQVRDDLARFVDPRWSAAEWRARFDERVAALRARGDLTPERLVITDAGRARVAAALGVDPVPDWRTVKRWILPAIALGLAPGGARVRDRLRENLNGLVLQREHKLGEPGLPTRRQVIDALAWRRLGVETDKPMTIKAVQRLLLGQLLESESRLDPDKLVGLLAAKAVGARRPGADPLREALVRNWLAPEASAAAPGEASDEAAGDVTDEAPDEVPDEAAPLFGTAVDPADAVPAFIAGPMDQTAPASLPGPADQTVPAYIAAPSDATAPMSAPGFDLAAFAREVQAAADREQEGRFGARKVFIAAVWRRLEHALGPTGMDLAAFKRHLVDANRSDLLALHRADLVPLMDPEEVKASEILYGNASFHFIESPFVRR